MSTLRDYSHQARTYDVTRGASPSVLGPLREALADAPGRRLADVGGGTGNYAQALRVEGWDPVVIDREPAMLAHAAAKGLATIEADAQRLPLADGSLDAVMLVSMLHHVENQPAALAEARRVLRPGGRLALMVHTREDVERSWLVDYFPSTRAWMPASHPPLAALLFHLPGARRIEVTFGDLEDGSLAALEAHPELVLDPRWHRQTSYFERLERDHPDELRAGLDRLRDDLGAGRAPRTPGSATVLAYAQPARTSQRTSGRSASVQLASPVSESTHERSPPVRIEVKGRNLRITDELREVVARRFEKVDKQVSDLATLEIELSEERNRANPDQMVAEATLYLKGTTLRAKNASRDAKHSINLVADELARQVKRHRDKRRKRRESRALAGQTPPPVGEPEGGPAPAL